MTGFLGFIANHGYSAVFLLIFIQEIGIPTIPNELVLIFAGALTTIGGLSYLRMFLTAVSADVIGTSTLFCVFYFFEKNIMEKIPKWIPINEYLDKIKKMIEKYDKWAIMIGRMMPYGRGYVSVAAGILNISYRVFLPMVFISAIVWSGGYVTLGHFLGFQWKRVADFISGYQWLVLVGVVLAVLIWIYISHRKRKHQELNLTKKEEKK